MSTITELLNDQQAHEQQETQPAVQTQGATTTSSSPTAPDDPCCTPIGPDPGPDR
jgi:hypothetical protein